MKVQVGERIYFRRFTWEITRCKVYPSGAIYYKYRVHRRYFRQIIRLSNTRCDYWISEDRWLFFKRKLQENPNYHYTQDLWSAI